MATYEVTVSGTSFAVSIAGVGQQGAAGADGADLIFRGAWLTGTAFSVDDLVSNNGSTYACILDHTSSATDEPGVGANTDTYWTIFVSGGLDGTDGSGWTGGSYDAGTGVVTFTSDDGLGFVTGDLRGADGTGSGTVTSIDITGGTGIASTGGPVTTSGAITVALDAGTIASLALADSAQQPPSEGAFVDGDKTKLDGIETGATADQTGAEIKSAYEAEANTNAYTDAEKSKLAGIEAGADVTDTANVTSAGALMDSEVANLADVKSFDPADYATAAQGALADSAAQADDVETADINAQTGTTYTLVIGDRGQVVTMNNANANTVTIPTNASVAFDIGSVVTVIQIGAGVTTIAGATGVTVNGTSAGSVSISAQYQGVSLLNIATDTWIASGAT